MARIRTQIGAILAVSLSVLFLYGCMAGGYSSSTRNGHEKVYRNDEGGKTLVYEVAKDGTVTIHDETDPRAQELQEAQKREEMSMAADAERLELIAAAPKREPGSPIFVALYETELDASLKQAQHSDGAVFAELRKNFENDAVIRLGGNGQAPSSELSQFTRALKGESTKAAPAYDVSVWSKASVEERAGIDKKTGKLGTMAVIVFEATISSNYLPAVHTVTEEGNIFRNDEVTRRFAEKIKHVIANEIGPAIPADRSL